MGAVTPMYAVSLAMALSIGASVSGCGGGAGAPPPQVQAPGAPTPIAPGAAPPTTGSGTLTVAVTDIDGKPLIDAHVYVWNSNQTGSVGNRSTGSNGTVTFGSVPAVVRVSVYHEFGVPLHNEEVAVAQQGETLLAMTMQADRPRPTVALLPVSIEPGSVSTDRSELTLEVTLVASQAAAFLPAGYGDYSPASTPALGFGLGQWDEEAQRQCFVWLDRTRTEPSCGTPWGTGSPYTVSVQRFTYDKAGTVPPLAVHGPTRSALLLMDQSRRVAELDPAARRSFALRRFIERTIDRGQLESLSLAGFAGTDSSTPSALPSQPLWLPLGAGTPFATDSAALKSAVGMLEPYVGGTAPVLESLQAAINVTATGAPPGNRAIVAMLGGGDDRNLSETTRRSALAALRQQRDAAGIQSVLIVGAPAWSAERLAAADLAAALRAPAISLGLATVPQGRDAPSWTAGSFAAFDLAADLIGGLPLPTLSAVFRVKATLPTTFVAGATLYGVVYVESGSCGMGCPEFPVEFAVEVP